MSSLAVNGRLDATAICISTACIIHCLALPVVAATLPLFASIADAEWVHKVFILAAIPISVTALALSSRSRVVLSFFGLVSIGLGLLVAGAFVEALHDHETLLTVSGALVLSFAHLMRWRHAQAALN